MHDHAVIRTTKYFTSTSTYVDLPDVNIKLITHGVVYRTDKEIGIKCYIYADFFQWISSRRDDNVEKWHVAYEI